MFKFSTAAVQKFNTSFVGRLRTTEGRRLWGELWRWLRPYKRGEKRKREILPKSPLGEAVTYLWNQRKALREPWRSGNGHLEVDNNAAERDLRSIAIGRKNWLFTGSERGGQVAAVMYGLIASAKRQDPHLDLAAYLEWVLREMPKLRDEVNGGKKGWGDYEADERLDAYLPDAWHRQNPRSSTDRPITARAEKFAESK